MEGKEDVRKVQLTGKSTYIISLPRRWVNEVNLKKGDTLTIKEQNNNSLLLIPRGVKKVEKVTGVSVKVSSKEKVSSIIRKVISFYLVGYNTIHLITNEERIPMEQRDKIKSFVRRMLVGTEIISDSKNQIALQVLLSYPELSVADALRRIAIIAVSMHKDSLISLENCNHELAEEVIRTDDEVDRFSFYIIRQLKAAVQDDRIIREIGLDNPIDCLGYRLITKSVERVGDHAVRIAKNVLDIKKPVDVEIFKVLNEMSSLAVSGFEDSITALFSKDYLLADKVIESMRRIESFESKIVAQVFQKKFDAETTSILRLVIESIKRTAEYSIDIAEIVINLTALE